MRFLIHGNILPQAPAALAKHDHICHTLHDLVAGNPDVSGADASGADALVGSSGEAAPATNPALLLPLLSKKQWNLLTTDSDFIRNLYEHKLLFQGIIVLLLPDPDSSHDQGQAITRLFERYKRLTPGRLYTVTPSRVKIRQLPGGHN